MVKRGGMPSYTLYFQNRILLMFKLLAVFAAALVLAYLSEQNTKATIAAGCRYSVWNDWAYIGLVIVLTLFAGLRTSYNDTAGYLYSAEYAVTLDELFRSEDFYNPFKVPLFHLFMSAVKACFNNPQWVVFLSAAITQICFVRFFKKYSQSFVFSIFIYFTLDTFVFTLAALKQALAMAILTVAFSALEKKQWTRYFVLVFIAMLFHAYAIAFVVLPLFKVKPWRLFTFVFISATAIVMLNFETTITAFMEQVSELGKNISEAEVFSDTTINIFRLAVYAVPPFISLVFQKWVLRNTDGIENTFIHMSIISLAFMIMGTQAGANMFGRMGNYFELGTICYLPTMLKKTFDARSYRLITIIACICFMGFFVYANAVRGSFDNDYQAIAILKFISDTFGDFI